MITQVTSKVDLPATASSRSQDVLPKHKPTAEQTAGSDFSFSSPAHRASLEHAVGRVKEVLQQAGSHLQIEVDPDLERVVVKVLKGDSGEVIRQIPPQEVIDLAKDLSEAKGLLLGEHV